MAQVSTFCGQHSSTQTGQRNGVWPPACVTSRSGRTSRPGAGTRSLRSDQPRSTDGLPRAVGVYPTVRTLAIVGLHGSRSGVAVPTNLPTPGAVRKTSHRHLEAVFPRVLRPTEDQSDSAADWRPPWSGDQEDDWRPDHPQGLGDPETADGGIRMCRSEKREKPSKVTPGPAFRGYATPPLRSLVWRSWRSHAERRSTSRLALCVGSARQPSRSWSGSRKCRRNQDVIRDAVAVTQWPSLAKASNIGVH